MIQVYSAAKARFTLPGKSKEQAWKEVSAMFDPNAENPATYLVGDRRLECVRRTRPDDISSGDLYRTDSENYFKVVECTPYESYAYDERHKIPDQGYTDDIVRMEFFFRADFEGGTLVDIRRRHRGDVNIFERMFRLRIKSAVDDLIEIMNNPSQNRNMKDLSIFRDDSLLVNFRTFN